MNRSFPLLALTTLVLLGACSTDAERYYRLSSTGSVPANTNRFALGVGPVTLPDYIDRAELVFQSAPNRFEAPYEHRWAGNLRDGFTQVVGIDLARELGTGNLHTYPWEPGTLLRYQVPITVRKFHAESGKLAVLEVGWTVNDGRTRETLVRRAETFSEPIQGDGYEPIVAAQSRLVAKLARAIAASFPAR
ncbi:MAG: PqiC family protein [Chthoniobacteraceae bacterium]